MLVDHISHPVLEAVSELESSLWDRILPPSISKTLKTLNEYLHPCCYCTYLLFAHFLHFFTLQYSICNSAFYIFIFLSFVESVSLMLLHLNFPSVKWFYSLQKSCIQFYKPGSGLISPRSVESKKQLNYFSVSKFTPRGRCIDGDVFPFNTSPLVCECCK